MGLGTYLYEVMILLGKTIIGRLMLATWAAKRPTTRGIAFEVIVLRSALRSPCTKDSN